MNVAYFLKPKHDVSFMYDDFSLRQGIEKLKLCGYSAVPVISRDGKYVGTVSEGDFLKRIVAEVERSEGTIDIIEDFSKKPLTAIMKSKTYEPVSITATAKDLLNKSMEQNYVPVVDDDGIFIGIVTRRDIIKYFIYSPE